jgi:ADP-ribosylglycohydrolase
MMNHIHPAVHKHEEHNMEDRSRGTLIGLAVGDALGAAVEFQSPGSFPPVTGYRGGWTAPD